MVTAQSLLDAVRDALGSTLFEMIAGHRSACWSGCTSPKPTASCAPISSGAAPLDQVGREGYVDDMAEIAAKLGVVNPPRTERVLAQRINAFRPELRSTPAARDAAWFLLLMLLLLRTRPGPRRSMGAARRRLTTHSVTPGR
jgi:hypothetical protein